MAGPQKRSVVVVTSDFSNWTARILLLPNKIEIVLEDRSNASLQNGVILASASFTY
jgi:hypothetical protein